MFEVVTDVNQFDCPMMREDREEKRRSRREDREEKIEKRRSRREEKRIDASTHNLLAICQGLDQTSQWKRDDQIGCLE